MADESEDQSQKTEDPTPHRLEEARKKGQIAYSREVNNFFVMLALALMIAWIFPVTAEQVKLALAPYIVAPHDFLIDGKSLRDALGGTFIDMAVVLLAPLAIVVLLVIGAAMMQSRLIFALERIKPKMEKVSVIKGVKRLFSMRSVVEFLKGIIKISVVSLLGVFVVYDDLPRLRLLPSYELTETLHFLALLALKVTIAACCIMFFVAILDYVYQHHEFMKQMRMSKKEIKDEHKQQEGDPMVKAKLRQIRMERARQRMMANVPKADVVITNPTHYAVALQYNSTDMRAPVVLAKGVDTVAFRIRDVAKEHDIPVVENPPLARALHASVDIDEEIPFEHYKAVAEVISYVYKLKGRKT